MRKFMRRLGSRRGFAVCVLCLLVGLAGVFVLQAYASLTPEEVATQRYKALMAGTIITSPDDLVDLWADEVWRYIPPPGATCWTQTEGDRKSVV